MAIAKSTSQYLTRIGCTVSRICTVLYINVLDLDLTNFSNLLAAVAGVCVGGYFLFQVCMAPPSSLGSADDMQISPCHHVDSAPLSSINLPWTSVILSGVLPALLWFLLPVLRDIAQRL
jgi:hypothetical protein